MDLPFVTLEVPQDGSTTKVKNLSVSSSITSDEELAIRLVAGAVGGILKASKGT